MMHEAHSRMTGLEANPDGTPGIVQALFKGATKNYLSDPRVQQYQGDARAWVTRDIQLQGRPVTEPAIQTGLQTFTAQPGDDPKTVANKAAMRDMEEQFHQSLAGSTGGDQPPPAGNPATGRTLTIGGMTVTIPH